MPAADKTASGHEVIHVLSMHQYAAHPYTMGANVTFIYSRLSSFVSYYRYNFYRDPGSLLYGEEYAFEREYNAYRGEGAYNYIEEIYFRGYLPDREGRNKSYDLRNICIVEKRRQIIPSRE